MVDKKSSATSTLEMTPHVRWQLVERIVSSPAFAKSERLATFLQCVCQLDQSGQLENINEKYIGTMVFGRQPDYDPGIDGIVRTHASRLRQKLQQYFEEDGASEEVVLTVPRGSYRPIFETRVLSNMGISEEALAPVPATLEEAENAQPPAFPATQSPVLPKSGASERPRRTALAVTLVTALTCFLGLAALGVSYPILRHSHPIQADASETARLFWQSLCSSQQTTFVVNADSGLVILKGFTKKRVSLDDYLSGEYLRHLGHLQLSEPDILNLASRRYSTTVDISLADKIIHLPGIDLSRTHFRFARDLQMEDAKEANLILLGTYESTPWVQLFEPSMNFYFQNDLTKGVSSFVNRNPRVGEPVRYTLTRSDPTDVVFGVVAYRPALRSSGKVLILEGQTMAGTQTASDFVFDDSRFLPFLKSIRRSDGTIPYFEILLRSRSTSAQASIIETVAYRVEDR